MLFGFIVRTANDIKVLSSCEIPPARIEFLKELGQGAFGKVHKAKLADGLKFFADAVNNNKKNYEFKIVAVKELHGEYQTPFPFSTDRTPASNGVSR